MRFVFFGSIPAATKALAYLEENSSTDEIYVATKKGYKIDKGKTVEDFAEEKKLRFITHNEILQDEDSFDYGFTFRYHRIIGPEVIDSFRHGIINFHGGLLPKYRGSANHIFALLNDEEYHGVSFHFIDEGIDTGPIIQTKKFPIEQEDTGYDLLVKSMVYGYELFQEIVEAIGRGEEIHGERQDKSEGTTYTEKDLKKYQQVNLHDISDQELQKRLRAFYHPYKKGLTTFVSDLKVELRLFDD